MGFAPKSETIVILYENDVHCAVEGYSKLAAMKKELSKQYNHVGVVSSGDYLQGGSLGVVSRGEYIVKLMNLVGYDAVTLGNHEFDYKLPRLLELVELMNTKPVCANFKDDSGNNVFEPYKIVSYGDIDVAYIGVTTPHTLTSSSPAQFKNKEGEYVYNFCANDLYEVVQGAIDAVKEKGADVIIAITHLGYMEEGLLWPVDDLIENTEGLDVVLDAHSHSVIEGVEFEDKEKNILYDNLATSKALDNPCFEETIRLYAKQELSRDVILFNNGLHGWHLEDETEYKEAFDKMIKFLLHEFPGTPIYVVLTTHLADKNREKRVIKRNEAALETAKRYNLPIIDLYKISLENSALLKNDGVHYDEAGCILFLNEILKTLNI